MNYETKKKLEILSSSEKRLGSTLENVCGSRLSLLDTAPLNARTAFIVLIFNAKLP